MSITTLAAEVQAKQTAELYDAYGSTENWAHAPSMDGFESHMFERTASKEHHSLVHPAKTATHMNLVRDLEASGAVTPMRVSTPEIQNLRMQVQHPRLPSKVSHVQLAESADPTTTYTLLGVVALLLAAGATIYSGY